MDAMRVSRKWERNCMAKNRRNENNASTLSIYFYAPVNFKLCTKTEEKKKNDWSDWLMEKVNK